MGGNAASHAIRFAMVKPSSVSFLFIASQARCSLVCTVSFLAPPENSSDYTGCQCGCPHFTTAAERQVRATLGGTLPSYETARTPSYALAISQLLRIQTFKTRQSLTISALLLDAPPKPGILKSMAHSQQRAANFSIKNSYALPSISGSTWLRDKLSEEKWSIRSFRSESGRRSLLLHTASPKMPLNTSL